MTKDVKTFLEKIEKEKKDQLMGIALDLKYWEKVMGEPGEGEILRTELSKENAKRIHDKRGNVVKDERDIGKVDTLNKRINQIEQAKQETTRLNDMDKGIREYLAHVLNPDKKTLDQMESVLKIGK